MTTQPPPAGPDRIGPALPNELRMVITTALDRVETQMRDIWTEAWQGGYEAGKAERTTATEVGAAYKRGREDAQAEAIRHFAVEKREAWARGHEAGAREARENMAAQAEAEAELGMAQDPDTVDAWVPRLRKALTARQRWELAADLMRGCFPEVAR
jgi:hypothetical protein